MPITTRKAAPPSPLQKFRSLTEGLLMEVAQEAMLQDYPGTGTRPARKSGLIYTLLRLFFLPGFKLTPWPIRRKMMSLFFVHHEQRWPAQPWKSQEKDKR
jgi:hypothetical protein